MKIDQHGTKQSTNKIDTLVNYLEQASDLQLWDYMGLSVEIDPTIDYTCQNVLIRWVDVNEGFNDRLIVSSFSDFTSQFRKIKA